MTNLSPEAGAPSYFLSNNIGIGTSNPGHTLDVSSAGTYGIHVQSRTTSANLGIRLSNAAGATADFGIAGGAGAWVTGTSVNDSVLRITSALLVSTYGTTTMCVSGTRVGIGKTAPTAFLDIGNSGLNGGLQIYGLSNNNIARPAIDTSSGFPTVTPSYEIRASSANGADGFLRIRAGGIGFNSANAASYIDLAGFSSVADMLQNIVLGTSGTERMRIMSNGNVGIGTAGTTPVGRLEVFSGGIVMNRLGNITAQTDVSAIVEGSRNVGMYWQKGVNNNFCGISFKALSNDTLIERLRIDADTGRIGIGSTAPETELEIRRPNNGGYDGGTSTDGTRWGITMRSSNTVGTRIMSVNRDTAGGTWKTELVFSTNFNTVLNDRMRLTGEGFLGIGLSNPTFMLQLSSNSAGKPGGSTWSDSSDRRIKLNIVDADVSRCYDIVKQLPLKRYGYIPEYVQAYKLRDTHVVGWIAQEVETVFPNAVTVTSQESMLDISNFYWLDVDQIYKTMYGALTKVIRDKEALETKITAVETLLTKVIDDKQTLEARFAALVDRVSALEGNV
jgi:hypothetical protein